MASGTDLVLELPLAPAPPEVRRGVDGCDVTCPAVVYAERCQSLSELSLDRVREFWFGASDDGGRRGVTQSEKSESLDGLFVSRSRRFVDIPG